MSDTATTAAPGAGEVLAILKEHLPELEAQFGVREVALFGSVARDEARAGSDIDLLVSRADVPWEGWHPTSAMRTYLKELFGWNVDVILTDELRPEVRKHVEKDAIRVEAAHPPQGARADSPADETTVRSPMDAKDPALYLRDMLDACGLIIKFTSSLRREDFDPFGETSSAVVRQICVLGEAANVLPDDLKAEHPDIPWQDMTDMRNILVHKYFRINDDHLWAAAREHVPALVPRLRSLLGLDPGADTDRRGERDLG